MHPPMNTTTAPIIELKTLNIPKAETAIMKNNVRSMAM